MTDAERAKQLRSELQAVTERLKTRDAIAMARRECLAAIERLGDERDGRRARIEAIDLELAALRSQLATLDEQLKQDE